MKEQNLSGQAAPRTKPPSLFDTVAVPGNAYGEAMAVPSQPRDHWQPLTEALDAMGAKMLNQHQERVRRMRHEDGATFNPFDDARKSSRCR